jgi:hypothetical protein
MIALTPNGDGYLEYGGIVFYLADHSYEHAYAAGRPHIRFHTDHWDEHRDFQPEIEAHDFTLFGEFDVPNWTYYGFEVDKGGHLHVKAFTDNSSKPAMTCWFHNDFYHGECEVYVTLHKALECAIKEQG